MGWKVISEITEEEVDINPDLYVKRAEYALVNHRIQDAIQEIDTAIYYAGTDVKSHYYFEKVKILYGGKKNKECYNFIDLHIETFFAELSMDKFMELLKLFNNVAILSKSNVTKLLNEKGLHSILLKELHAEEITYSYILERARECINVGKYDAAYQYCDLGIHLDSNGFAIYEMKGRCYHHDKNYEKALEYYNRSILLNKENIPALLSRSQVYSVLGNLDETMISLDMIIAISPGNLEYLRLKAEEYLRVKKYQAAIDHLYGMKSNGYRDAKTYQLIGQAHDGLGNFWRAFHYYKKSVAMDQTFAIPEKDMREARIQSVKRRVILTSILMIFLFTAQFVLFKTGVLPAIVFDVQISKTSEIVAVGGTINLSEQHRRFPFYAVDPELTFKILDERMAMMDSEGVLKGIKEGDVEIVLMRGKRVLDNFVITSIEPKVTKISVGNKGNKLKFGQTLNLEPQITMNYDGFLKAEILFSSSHPDIISVSPTGMLKAIGIGEAEISIRAGDIEEKMTMNSEAIVEILIEQDHYYVYYGDRMTLVPKVVMTPKEAAAQVLEYVSKNPEIISVDSKGEIDVVGVGTAYIEVRGGDVTKEIHFTSEPRTDKIQFEEEAYELKYGESIELPQPKITISPLDAFIPSIQYDSTNDQIIQVDTNGYVTAVGIGEAHVVVTVGNKQEKLLFTSHANVKSIQFNSNFYEMNIGKILEIELVVVLEPADAPVPEITYDSFDTEILELDMSGEIKAIRNGRTGIQVTCGDISRTLSVEVLNGAREGYSTYFGDNRNNEYRYDGEFRDYKFHGEGKQTYENGDLYEGNWLNGKKHGQGSMIYSNGDQYKGSWEDSVYHGEGTMSLISGEKYEGSWFRGRKQGLGNIIYANGNKYDGDWSNDYLHGFGTYTWLNGDQYIGQWSMGKQHGNGTLTLVDGTSNSGTWSNGSYSGR